MRIKCFTLAAALVLAVALVGCSSSKVTNTEAPINSVHPSAAQSNGVRESDHIDYDDNRGDQDNGRPDTSPNGSDQMTGDNALDDVGNAAGDLVDGAGDVVRDAGDAIGNAANNVGRAMR